METNQMNQIDKLTDVGTGDLQIIVFNIENRLYCINILKSKEIVNMIEYPITKLPNSDLSYRGLINLRSKIYPVIDLKYVLEQKETEINENTKGLLCIFNQTEVVFLVDDVRNIEYINWKDLKQPEGLIKSDLVVGTILKDKEILVLLDFEKIVVNETENNYIKEVEHMPVKKDRANYTIYLAEDSSLIRTLIEENLTKAGYTKITTFPNGRAALDVIEKDPSLVDLLITDIEMPELDGLTLTRTIKENKNMNKIPVIVFSSLITDELRHKGQKVGADYQISKPEIGELVGVVDRLLKI